jgi:hypothetical protein
VRFVDLDEAGREAAGFDTVLSYGVGLIADGNRTCQGGA